MQSDILIEILREAPYNSKLVVRVVSDSMKPLYRQGDQLIIEKTTFDTIKANDVIVFSYPTSVIPVVHRVVEIREAIFIARGDNCPLDDVQHVEKSWLIGRVLRKI